MKVDVEGIGTEWGRAYTESIRVNLDQEETTVKVELVARPFSNAKSEAGTSKVPRVVGTRGGTSRSWGKDLSFILGVVGVIAIVIVVVNFSRTPKAASVLPTETRSSAPAAVTTRPNPTSAVTTPVSVSAPIQYGQTITGGIAKAGDYQDLKFTGQVGDTVTIHSIQDGGASLQPYLALMDPSGTKVTENWGVNGYKEARIANYKLAGSGTYTIRAGGWSGSIGGYKMDLLLKPTVAVIAYGQEVKGQIAFKDDYQDLKFTGQVGDIVTIHSIQDGGASLQPYLVLMDPSGTKVTENWGVNGYKEARFANYKLAGSGTYTIRAGGWSGSIGGYKMDLLLKPTVAVIAYGQEVKGQIAFKDDYQDLKFTGQVGDTVTIHSIQDGGASLQPYLALMDPSGTR